MRNVEGLGPGLVLLHVVPGLVLDVETTTPLALRLDGVSCELYLLLIIVHKLPWSPKRDDSFCCGFPLVQELLR